MSNFNSPVYCIVGLGELDCCCQDEQRSLSKAVGDVKGDCFLRF